MVVTSPTGANKVATPSGTSTMTVTSPTGASYVVCVRACILLCLEIHQLLYFFSIISLCSTVHVEYIYSYKCTCVLSYSFSESTSTPPGTSTMAVTSPTGTNKVATLTEIYHGCDLSYWH